VYSAFPPKRFQPLRSFPLKRFCQPLPADECAREETVIKNERINNRCPLLYDSICVEKVFLNVH